MTKSRWFKLVTWIHAGYDTFPSFWVRLSRSGYFTSCFPSHSIIPICAFTIMYTRLSLGSLSMCPSVSSHYEISAPWIFIIFQNHFPLREGVKFFFSLHVDGLDGPESRFTLDLPRLKGSEGQLFRLLVWGAWCRGSLWSISPSILPFFSVPKWSKMRMTWCFFKNLECQFSFWEDWTNKGCVESWQLCCFGIF